MYPACNTATAQSVITSDGPRPAGPGPHYTLSAVCCLLSAVCCLLSAGQKTAGWRVLRCCGQCILLPPELLSASFRPQSPPLQPCSPPSQFLMIISTATQLQDAAQALHTGLCGDTRH